MTKVVGSDMFLVSVPGHAHWYLVSHLGLQIKKQPQSHSFVFQLCFCAPSCAAPQTISLSALSPILEFSTTVEWAENRKLLKVSEGQAEGQVLLVGGAGG